MQNISMNSLKGLVYGSVPAEESDGSEQNEPEDWESEVHSSCRSIYSEIHHTGQQVEKQRHTVICWKKIIIQAWKFPQMFAKAYNRSSQTIFAAFSMYSMHSTHIFCMHGWHSSLAKISSTKQKTLTHPEVVHHLANPLIFHRDFFIEILIKARFYGEKPGQRWPVVFFTCNQANISFMSRAHFRRTSTERDQYCSGSPRVVSRSRSSCSLRSSSAAFFSSSACCRRSSACPAATPAWRRNQTFTP